MELDVDWWVDGRTLRSEELAGDVEGFAADDDDFLAVQQLFGDGAGEAAEEVAFAVYHNLGEVLVWICSCRHLLCIQLMGVMPGVCNIPPARSSTS